MEKKFLHKAEKPLELIMKLVHCSSNEEDVVLDPFLGSGTTAVACEKLRRRWIGIEIEEEFCKVAKKRLEDELKVKRLF
jgi:DNA modification methylase